MLGPDTFLETPSELVKEKMFYIQPLPASSSWSEGRREGESRKGTRAKVITPGSRAIFWGKNNFFLFCEAVDTCPTPPRSNKIGVIAKKMSLISLASPGWLLSCRVYSLPHCCHRNIMTRRPSCDMLDMSYASWKSLTCILWGRGEPELNRVIPALGVQISENTSDGCMRRGGAKCNSFF